jgi:hypothetical protein
MRPVILAIEKTYDRKKNNLKSVIIKNIFL